MLTQSTAEVDGNFTGIWSNYWTKLHLLNAKSGDHRDSASEHHGSFYGNPSNSCQDISLNEMRKGIISVMLEEIIRDYFLRLNKAPPGLLKTTLLTG